MFEAIFAMVTLWSPPEPVASPVASIADRLPQTLDATGLNASTPLDSRPLVSVCTFGGGTLDGFSFAHIADLARASSLPACGSSLDRAQLQALDDSIGPFGIVQTGMFGEFGNPVLLVSPAPHANALLLGPATPPAYRLPATFSGITHLSGPIAGPLRASGATTTRGTLTTRHSR